MYASYPFSAAQAIVELPYVGVQAVLYCCITYWMVSCAPSVHSASSKFSVLALCSAVGEAPLMPRQNHQTDIDRAFLGLPAL